jgi:uncharacterized membrane protein
MSNTNNNTNTKPTTHTNPTQKGTNMNTPTQEQTTKAMEEQLKRAQRTANITGETPQEVIQDTQEEVQEGIISSLTTKMKDIYHYSKDTVITILTWMKDNIGILLVIGAYAVGTVISGTLWYGLFCLLGII